MINVLISPVAPLHDEPGDFRFTDDGELVMVGLVTCDRGCGCERSFSGLNSKKGTTVAVVAQRDLTRDDLLAAAADYSLRCGWGEGMIGAFQGAMTATLAIAADQDVGAELRISRDADGEIVVRALPAAA